MITILDHNFVFWLIDFSGFPVLESFFVDPVENMDWEHAHIKYYC